MKTLIRNTTINALSLYILNSISEGVKITGGIEVFIISGLLLAIMMAFLKPIFNLISLPLNLVTLGLFSFFSNAIIIYFLTILVPNISISSFVFEGLTFAGFVVPEMRFNTISSYVVSAGLISLFNSYFYWLQKS